MQFGSHQMQWQQFRPASPSGTHKHGGVVRDGVGCPARSLWFYGLPHALCVHECFAILAAVVHITTQ